MENRINHLQAGLLVGFTCALAAALKRYGIDPLEKAGSD